MMRALGSHPQSHERIAALKLTLMSAMCRRSTGGLGWQQPQPGTDTMLLCVPSDKTVP